MEKISIFLIPKTLKMMKLTVMVGMICMLQVGFAQTNDAYKLSDSTFVTGHIQHPIELIKGMAPGVLVAEPNTTGFANYDIRIRGSNTFQSRSNPLIVLDGLVVPSFDFIDPNEIKEISVIRGSETARYGMQGASGVIVITTKKGSGNFHINYHGFASVDSKIYKQRSLLAKEYHSLGGSDFGSSTNWVDETTQTAFSNVNHLSFGQQQGNFSYRLGMNYRDGQGVQKETEFDRFNGLASLSWKPSQFLELTYLGGYNNETATPGFTEVNRYALSANPTMPIFFESGDYYQPITFDYYNPLAIIALSERERTTTNHLNLLQLTSNVGIAKAAVYASNSNQQYTLDEHYEDQLFYRGGEIYQKDYLVNHNHLGGRVSLHLKSDNWSFIPSLQFDNHIYRFEDKVVSSVVSASQNFIQTTFQKDQIVLIGGTIATDINFSDKWSVSVGDRLEASSALGDDNDMAHFPWINTRVNLSNLIGFGGTNFFTFGHGKSGMTLYQDGLSTAQIEDWGTARFANPGLRSEVVQNTDIGMEWRSSNGRLGISGQWYWKVASDMIWETYYNNGEERAEINVNAGKLSNQGLELVIDYSQEIGAVNWQTQLVTSTFNSAWKSLKGDRNIDLDSTRYGLVFNAGFSSPSVIYYKENEPFGAITAIKTTGIDQSGTWNTVDVDGDGYAYLEDLQVTGQAIPKWTLSWFNTFKYRKFSAAMQVTGAFGHSLVNETAVMYQPNASWYYYNFLESYQEIEPVDDRFMVDYFVQKASYLRMSYLQFAYSFKDQPGKTLSNLQVYIAGNNLLTFSKYLGNNPDYRLSKKDFGLDTSRSTIADSKLPGYDAANQMYSSRSFTLGVKLSLF